MSSDVPKVTDFGLAKFTTPHAHSLTVAITKEFDELTRLRIEFGRGTHSVNQELVIRREQEQRMGTPSAGDERRKEDIRQFLRDAGRRWFEEKAREDLSTDFQDYVVRSEWKKRMGTPDAEDVLRLNTIRQFIQEALRQASLDVPEDSYVRDKLTESGAIMGTAKYMAPEQAWGRTEEVGPSADIYSLGAIMYEMLTGRPPFTGDLDQVLMKVRTRPPVPPRQRRDSIDPGLEAICMKCLEKTVERRYPSMGKLAEDLQRSMNGAG
jgi:serine/threonine protein kinase